jgi:hypothetical protein
MNVSVHPYKVRISLQRIAVPKAAVGWSFAGSAVSLADMIGIQSPRMAAGKSVRNDSSTALQTGVFLNRINDNARAILAAVDAAKRKV